MIGPASGLSKKHKAFGSLPRATKSFAESVLDNITDHPDVVDFDARDLLSTYLIGDTPTNWVSRRGGLTASAAGSPTYEAPDATVGTPSVAYSGSGSEYHATAATLDWSTYTTATLISVCYTPAGAGTSVRGPGAMSAGTSGAVPTAGGITHYFYDDKATGLHKADHPGSFVFERDNTVDAGVLRVIVTAHDTAASDEIRVWVDGVEETGTQSGNSFGNPWFSAMQVRLGSRGGPGEGLDGRLHRFIALPVALSDAQALRASKCLVNIHRLP